MGKSVGPYANRGPIEFTSVSVAVAYSPPIVWIHVISAGSGGLVVKTEDGTARTYTGLAAGDVLIGPFTELTSMTLSKIRVGDGAPPQSTTFPAAPSATGALGSVKVSVAPSDTANPTAVGTNDPRVTQVEVALPLVLADGTMAESTVWIPGVVGTITGATLSANANITQSDSNLLTFTLGIRDGAGGSASTVASRSTAVTGGFAFLAFQALTLGAITNPTTTATSQITFKSVKTGSGQAVTGPALLRVTYSVP